MIWEILATLATSATSIAIFVYFMKKGQFDNIEDIKYQMFRDEQPDNKK